MSEIRMFWQWFAANHKDFGAGFDNGGLLGELDERIGDLGDFNWEVGPGSVENNLLVISPNGDPDLLPETKRIIENAIPCAGWEFYYAKQPKDWDLKFDFVTAEGAVVKIDASPWEYVLLGYEDGMFGVIIKGSYHLNQLGDNDRLAAAEIVLDGILGEELRMKSICEIDVVGFFDGSYEKKASDIKDIANHLKKLLNTSESH